MKFKRIDHIGVVVNDLDAAKAFFLDFGLEVVGEAELEGEYVDKTVGLKGARASIVVMRPPDGGANIELILDHQPPNEQQRPKNPNTVGISNISFAVDDIEAVVARMREKGMELFGEIAQYQDFYKLCYIRGPEGIILMLAEALK